MSRLADSNYRQHISKCWYTVHVRMLFHVRQYRYLKICVESRHLGIKASYLSITKWRTPSSNTKPPRLRSRAEYTAVQRQKAVSAYFTSKQILPSGFAEQYSHPHVISQSIILDYRSHSILNNKLMSYNRQNMCDCSMLKL